MEATGLQKRMVWTGNAARQPAFQRVPMRIGEGGTPNADHVMEQGVILPMNHGLDDAHMHFIGDVVDDTLERLRG